MPVTQYSYSDTSAPVLSGTVGSMITLLDAVLVNGYGSKAAAGWTKVYSGTNIAVYRNNPSAPGSTGMYLRVDDTVTTSCTIRAYKTMSDINTGTDMIPSGTPSYTNASIFWVKSNAANATPKMWQIIADDRTFYINYCPNSDTTTGNMSSYAHVGGAGDFETFVPGNTWNYFIAGNYTGTASDHTYNMINSQSSYGVMLMGRSQELAPNKQTKAWILYVCGGNLYESGYGLHNLYSPYTGQRFFYPAYMVESSTATQENITGKLRGAYGLAGRCSVVWAENYGKLPDDPSGPDMIQFYSTAGGQGNAFYVRLGNW